MTHEFLLFCLYKLHDKLDPKIAQVGRAIERPACIVLGTLSLVVLLFFPEIIEWMRAR